MHVLPGGKMTERYSFAVDSNVVWSQDNVDIVNSTLTDTINEGYVTAEEDSPTRYLSVLDTTGEISLENLNITLTNPKLEAEDNGNYVTEEVEQEETGDQVVVFSVEGSDELFGIQVVRDDEGNLQKYQFQFRKNETGQLEAIPETITLIPVEEEGQEGNQPDEEEVEYAHEEEQAPSMHIFVQESEEEHILPDNLEEQAQEVQEEQDETVVYENEEAEEEIVDVKPGIGFQNIKQEIQEHQVEYEAPESMEDEEEEIIQNQQFEPQHEDDLVEYHNQMQQEENSMSSEPPPEETQSVDDQEYEHVEVNPDVNIPSEENAEAEQENPNDSDENDYQIVEGLHITGDVEHPTEKQTINTNILKHALKMNKDHKIVKKDNRLYLYVVQHPEKENVESLAMEMSNLCRPKVNPRSILKSSHAMFQSKNEMEDDLQQDERLNKRFARCKEAMQARIFHNFINKTTIPQAPVRKNRLPRKQKIKPVERMDEEIVVQEMMVSSNGFVEAVGGRGVDKENLAVTDYVELTDSDDDYDPKKASRKKKKHRRKRIEITISDDSDASAEDSVIELDESDDEPHRKEEDKSTNANTPTKRRRGRPPKGGAKKPNPDESPAKKSRVEETEAASSKPEIPCPKCDKTFPSQNSLKTHLQHHNLQSSIKRALPDYKYKCDKCGTTFINNILLRKHMCSKLFSCAVCKRKFGDLPSLNAHKRTHAKEQMVKSTTTVQVSPKKIKPAPTNQFKVPKPASICKCKTCGKLCSSMQNLNVHMKSHKEFVCGTCSATFASQLVLEKHVRESCVKSPLSRRSKSMVNVRRSTAKSPPRRSAMGATKVKCDKCSLVFGSHQAVFKHKVEKHGLETPDKSVLEADKEVKTGRGGVPPASRLRNAYAGLRVELDFDD